MQVGYIERMGEFRNVYKISVGIPEERDSMRDVRVDERIILKLIIKKQAI
jgi:hypothetical protein